MIQKLNTVISSFNNNEIAILILLIVALIFFKPLYSLFTSLFMFNNNFLKSKIF